MYSFDIIGMSDSAYIYVSGKSKELMSVVFIVRLLGTVIMIEQSWVDLGAKTWRL